MHRIFFNRSFSSIGHSIQALTQTDNLEIHCSHTQQGAFWVRHAHSRILEPERNGNRTTYVNWLLDYSKTHAIDLFWPQASASDVAGSVERFQQQGTRVLLPASPRAIAMMHDKHSTYRFFQDQNFVPDFRVVTNAAQGKRALAELRQDHPHLCIKPAVSIYGHGFRVLKRHGGRLSRMLHNDVYHLPEEEFLSLLRWNREGKRFLVMPFLPGPERSIDCLANHGELLRIVVRKKHDHQPYQEIENSASSWELTRTIVDKLKLHGVVNIQTRAYRGKHYLLEINPRMSGGLSLASLTGLDLPLWAIKLELGLAAPTEVPFPHTALKVLMEATPKAVETSGDTDFSEPWHKESSSQATAAF